MTLISAESVHLNLHQPHALIALSVLLYQDPGGWDGRLNLQALTDKKRVGTWAGQPLTLDSPSLPPNTAPVPVDRWVSQLGLPLPGRPLPRSRYRHVLACPSRGVMLEPTSADPQTLYQWLTAPHNSARITRFVRDYAPHGLLVTRRVMADWTAQ